MVLAEQFGWVVGTAPTMCWIVNEDWEVKKWRQGDESLRRSLSVKGSRERTISRGDRRSKKDVIRKALLRQIVILMRIIIDSQSRTPVGSLSGNTVDPGWVRIVFPPLSSMQIQSMAPRKPPVEDMVPGQRWTQTLNWRRLFQTPGEWGTLTDVKIPKKRENCISCHLSIWILIWIHYTSVVFPVYSSVISAARLLLCLYCPFPTFYNSRLNSPPLGPPLYLLCRVGIPPTCLPVCALFLSTPHHRCDTWK